MSSEQATRPFLIAGAGIAGLTTAIALAQRGLPALVLEQANELGEVGAGIQLQPNATRVLHALGMADALATHGVLHQGALLRRAGSGKVITRLPPASEYAEFPHYQIHRADLHNILVARATELGVKIKLDACVSNYLQDDGLEIQTTRGESVRGRALIGADGVKSTVRSIMIGVDDPVFTGHVCYRGLVDASALSTEIIPGGIAGAGRHFVCYPVRGGELVNFVAQVESDEWTGESWSTAADPSELRALFRDWDPLVTELLEQAENTFKWALYTRAPLASWSEKKVCLIGDACHPALPNLAAGAGMAIEDGYIIADLVTKYPQSVEQAFREFYRLRIDRCTAIQRRSEKMARFFHIRNPLLRELNYSTAALLTRIAPGLAQRRMTWTQEYNALTAVQH